MLVSFIYFLANKNINFSLIYKYFWQRLDEKGLVYLESGLYVHYFWTKCRKVVGGS